MVVSRVPIPAEEGGVGERVLDVSDGTMAASYTPGTNRRRPCGFRGVAVYHTATESALKISSRRAW